MSVCVCVCVCVCAHGISVLVLRHGSAIGTETIEL